VVEVDGGLFACGCAPEPDGPLPAWPLRSWTLGVVAVVAVLGLMPVGVVVEPGLESAGEVVAVPAPGVVVALLVPRLVPGAVVVAPGLTPVAVAPGVVVAVPVPGVVAVLTWWPCGCIAATG